MRTFYLFESSAAYTWGFARQNLPGRLVRCDLGDIFYIQSCRRVAQFRVLVMWTKRVFNAVEPGLLGDPRRNAGVPQEMISSIPVFLVELQMLSLVVLISIFFPDLF